MTRIYLSDYGVDKTGATDCTSQVQAWVTAVLAQSGNHGIASESGTYKINGQITFDAKNSLAGGLFEFSPGVYFNGDGSSSIPTFQFIDSSNSDGVIGWNIIGRPKFSSSVVGDVFRIGQRSYADKMNTFSWDIMVENHNSTDTTHTCSAIEINGLYSNSVMYIHGGCSGGAGAGDFVRLRSTNSNVFYLNGGNCQNGIHLTGANNTGNVFEAPDLEGCYNACVLSDIGNNSSNVINGGQYAYQGSGVGLLSTGGGNNGYNIMNCPNIPASPSAFIGKGDGTNTGTAFGWILKGTTLVPLSHTPGTPTSGVAAYNTSPFPIMIWIFGGTVSAIYMMGILTGATQGAFLIPPAASFQINYIALPTVTYAPAP